MKNINKIRREYTNNTLSRFNLTQEPMELFKIWLQEAIKFGISDPTAMCLATTDRFNYPHQRLVLLKKFNKKKIIFFTNLNSKKSIQIKQNPKVSVCFPWNTLDRQVIMLGHAAPLSQLDTKKYFYTRPKYNQISTWASYQSKHIKSKKIINDKFIALKKQFENTAVPIPNFWGGYQIFLDIIEFWQGRKNRLHDRFIYYKKGKKWHFNRLSP